jgi:hypothetical protein
MARDGGMMLLAEVERPNGLADRLAPLITDRRDPAGPAMHIKLGWLYLGAGQGRPCEGNGKVRDLLHAVQCSK